MCAQKIPRNRQYTWTSCLYQGVPRCCAMKNKSDEPCLTSAIQTRRPQRLNPLPIQNSARIRWFLLLECPQQTDFVCHFVFGQPTASFFLAHPYMENPPCEEGYRRSFSSGAERAGTFALSGASVRDWGRRRREDKQEDASTLSISTNTRGKWRRSWAMDAGRRRWHQHQHHRQPCDDTMQRTDDEAWRALDTNIYKYEAGMT